jgi:hypothetical protein
MYIAYDIMLSLLPKTVIGASSSKYIGCLQNMSLHFWIRNFISFSERLTGVPGFLLNNICYFYFIT